MKKLFTTTTFIITAFFAFAQQREMDAFQDSYAQEKLGNYLGAAMSISAVYNANAYEHNLRLGYLKYMSGATSEAITYYQKAIEQIPGAIEPRLGLSLCLTALAKWDDLMNVYEYILKLDPNNTLVSYKLGYIHYIRKNYTEAYKYFEKVVKLYPFDYYGLLMFAWTNHQLGKANEAKMYFKRLSLNSPNDKAIKEWQDLVK